MSQFFYIVHLDSIPNQMQAITPSSRSSIEQPNEGYTEKDGSSPNDIQASPIVREVEVLRERDEVNGGKPRKLGVTWNNLTVKGTSNDALFNENVLSQFNVFGKRARDPPMKTIIDDSFGCVKPGGT